MTTRLHVQWYDDGCWKDVSAPDDGTLLAETFTRPPGELPADSGRKGRLRFAGTGDPDGKDRLLTLTARVNGKVVGASERSPGAGPPLTLALRRPPGARSSRRWPKRTVVLSSPAVCT